MTSIF